MRTLRKAQNLSLDALQKKTGIPLDRLRSVDAGSVSPYLSEAKAISFALGTTIDAMVNGVTIQYALGAFRNIARSLPQNIERTGES